MLNTLFSSKDAVFVFGGVVIGKKESISYNHSIKLQIPDLRVSLLLARQTRIDFRCESNPKRTIARLLHRVFEGNLNSVVVSPPSKGTRAYERDVWAGSLYTPSIPQRSILTQIPCLLV